MTTAALKRQKACAQCYRACEVSLTVTGESRI